jgi:hypothetical protein
MAFYYVLSFLGGHQHHFVRERKEENINQQIQQGQEVRTAEARSRDCGRPGRPDARTVARLQSDRSGRIHSGSLESGERNGSAL